MAKSKKKLKQTAAPFDIPESTIKVLAEGGRKATILSKKLQFTRLAVKKKPASKKNKPAALSLSDLKKIRSGSKISEKLNKKFDRKTSVSKSPKKSKKKSPEDDLLKFSKKK